MKDYELWTGLAETAAAGKRTTDQVLEIVKIMNAMAERLVTLEGLAARLEMRVNDQGRLIEKILDTYSGGQ